jgi:hypothetical protein
MTINFINTGTGPNKGNGDSLRLAFTKINNNFQILSTLVSSADFNNILSGMAFVAGPGIAVVHNTVTNVVNVGMLPATTSTLGGIVVGHNLEITTENKLGAILSKISDTPPLNPILGDQWWDTASGQGYIFYQDTWVEVNPNIETPGTTIATSDTPPLNPVQGDQWWDTASGQGYIFYQGAWIEFSTPNTQNSIVLAATPVSATSPGIIGQLAYDDLYMYLCISTNVWKRIQWDSSW